MFNFIVGMFLGSLLTLVPILAIIYLSEQHRRAIRVGTGRGQIQVTPEMIERVSLYLFTALGPTKSVAYEDIVPGLIEAIFAQCRTGHLG